MVIILNTTESDIMITLLDITLAHTAIDAICNLNSGKDEMTKKKRKSTHYGGRKKFCGDDDVIPDKIPAERTIL